MKLSLPNLVTISALTMSASAFAADPLIVNGGTVHFVGELVNAACAVSTESANLTVNLGQYRTTSLAHFDDKTSPIPFNIQLVDCDPTVYSTAAVAFMGQISLEAPSAHQLAVSSSGSNNPTASHVTIVISDHNSVPMLINNHAFSGKYPLVEGGNNLSFSARYVATGAATPGQANANATFLIKYQ